MDSGYLVFPSQPQRVQPVKQQSGKTESKLPMADFIWGIIAVGMGTTGMVFCSRGERRDSTPNIKWGFYCPKQAEWEGCEVKN